MQISDSHLRNTQWLAMLLACVIAPNLAFNLVSSSATLNQLAALAGWGLVLLTMGATPVNWRTGPAVWALLLLLAAAWVSYFWAGLPMSLLLSYSGLLGAALLLLMLGQGLGSGPRQAGFKALCWGLLWAGLMGAVVSVVQVFAPDWAGEVWIARSDIPGRALGNLRQPNHLASSLIWACVAAVYLAEQRALVTQRRSSAIWLLPAVLLVLVFGLVLSASRGGMAMLGFLLLWVLLDRRISRPTRLAVLMTPLMLGLGWTAMSLWSQLGEHQFSAASRLAEGASSPKRLQYLACAWELLNQHPWTGVGWGEFNFALTMTPMPGRPNSFVDHTHNLLMQILVELGWPAGLLVLGLLAAALKRAFQLGRNETAPSEALLRHAALMLVCLILLQGLLEFQLWYAYFLLPAAFAFGMALAPPSPSPESAERKPTRARPLPLLGFLMVALSVLVFFDYLRVVAITVQPPNGMSLLDRITQAQQRSIFFSHQADYAASTFLLPGPEALDAARRSAHNVSDESTLIAWANSLVVSGDADRARYVVQRLREFNLPRTREWLAECERIAPDAKVRPYQCDAPRRQYSYREMR